MVGKLKTHRGAAKRFKKTGSGFKRKSAFKSHILTKMTTKRKRQLRGTHLLINQMCQQLSECYVIISFSR